jgi:hypothetical protein
MAAAGTTFGVFHWLEVMDLDLFFVFPFLCLVLHITFQLFVVCVCQWSRTPIDARL